MAQNKIDEFPPEKPAPPARPYDHELGLTPEANTVLLRYWRKKLASLEIEVDRMGFSGNLS